jgi:hypothetical protein
MINFKQKELIQEYFDALKAQFPEIEFLGVTESPEDPNDLWVNVIKPEDEEREIALIELAGIKTADILQNYGYYILIMPRSAKSELVRNSPQKAKKKRGKKIFA